MLKRKNAESAQPPARPSQPPQLLQPPPDTYAFPGLPYDHMRTVLDTQSAEVLRAEVQDIIESLRARNNVVPAADAHKPPSSRGTTLSTNEMGVLEALAASTDLSSMRFVIAASACHDEATRARFDAMGWPAASRAFFMEHVPGMMHSFYMGKYETLVEGETVPVDTIAPFVSDLVKWYLLM
jgi:hypothetical protein